MCKDSLNEIPSWLLNLVLIVFALFILIWVYIYKKTVDYQLIQILAIILGALVVGNSITQFRMKTVQNELIRSSIDIINHCITTKKLKVEMYHSAKVAGINKELDNVKKEAENALQEYIEFCKELRTEVVNETFKYALNKLNNQIRKN